jgi:hypothetical protein
MPKEITRKASEKIKRWGAAVPIISPRPHAKRVTTRGNQQHARSAWANAVTTNLALIIRAITREEEGMDPQSVKSLQRLGLSHLAQRRVI